MWKQTYFGSLVKNNLEAVDFKPFFLYERHQLGNDKFSLLLFQIPNFLWHVVSTDITVVNRKRNIQIFNVAPCEWSSNLFCEKS